VVGLTRFDGELIRSVTEHSVMHILTASQLRKLLGDDIWRPRELCKALGIKHIWTLKRLIEPFVKEGIVVAFRDSKHRKLFFCSPTTYDYLETKGIVFFHNLVRDVKYPKRTLPVVELPEEEELTSQETNSEG